MKLSTPALSAASLCLFLFVIPLARAVAPPRPGEIEAMKEAGTFAQAQEYAKSFGNYQMNPLLLSDAQARMRTRMLEDAGVTEEMQALAKTPGRTPRAAPRGARNLPTTGTPRTLTLLIDFSDATGIVSNAQVNSAIYGTGDSSKFPYESLSKYFERASYGKLKIQGATLGWYRYSQSRAQINAAIASIKAQQTAGTINGYQAAVQESSLRENMIKEALQSFDASTDYSQYDNNGDGKIDSLTVIYAGPDTGWGNFWWAYQTGAWAGPFNGVTFDGKSIAGYIFEFTSVHRDDSNNITGYDPRTTIHEHGHILGLPDLYDYDGSVGPPGGVGGLDMMHGNVGDINSFFKWVLDWKTPTLLSSGHKFIEMKPQATSDREAVVMMPGIQANGWLNDDFTTDTGYFSQWQRVTPIAGVSAIAHANQRVEFTGRAHFRTVTQFDPDVLGGVKVAGKWTFNNAGDTFHLATRSDGVPDASFYQEVTNGVVFNVTNAGVLTIYSRGPSLTVQQLTTGSVGTIPAGSSWNFEVFDDKDTGLAFRFTSVSNPATTATIVGRVTADTFGSNRIDIYNRELVTDRSFLDDVAIVPGPTATDLFAEMYVIENRSEGGNDDASDWPGGSGAALNFAGGLAIWHVDARLSEDGNGFAWNNSYSTHKLLRLMEADGLEQIENNRGADGLDFWKPGQSFDSRSTPNSNNYAGAFTGIAVTPIRNYRGTIWTHCSFWTNPAWRKPSITLNTPTNGTATEFGSMTVTATATDQSTDGVSQPPIVEFYRDGEPGQFARWDGLPAGQSTYSTNMSLPQVRSYVLSGFAQDRDNYPLVLASFPQVIPARSGFVNQYPPVNSFWATATALSGNAVNVTAYNTSNNAGGPGAWVAPDEADDPPVSAQGNNSARVWWRWTSTVPGWLTVSTAGSNFDTVLALYTGGRLDALREFASHDDVGGGNVTSLISSKWIGGGTTFYIMVSGYNDAQGTIQLALNFSPYVPGNDNLSSVLGTNFVFTGASGAPWERNNSATIESGEDAITSNTSSRSVWWRYSPAASGRLTLDTSGADYDTTLHVFRGTAGSVGANTIGTLQFVGYNDDFYGARRTSALGASVTAGQHYFIALDGYNSAHSGNSPVAWKFIARTANSAPTVSLVEPGSNLTVTRGTALHLRATSGDSDGFVSNVSFYSDAARTQLIRTVPANSESRYEADWTPAPGSYVITAVSTDDESATTNSNTFNVTVTDLLLANMPGTVDDRAWVVREIAKPSGNLNSLADADALIASGAAVERTWYTRSVNLYDPQAAGGGLLNNTTFPPMPFAINNLTPAGLVNGDDDDFVTVARCRFEVTAAGDYTFGFSSDDGARLRLYGGVFKSSTRLNTANPANPAHDGSTLKFDANTGNSDTLGVATLTPGIYGLEFTVWERAGGAYAECFVATGAKTAFDTTFVPMGALTGPLQLRNAGSIAGNDNFAAARLLQGTAPLSAGYSVNSTREAGETLTPGTGGSVWFTWSAPESGRYQFDTIGSQCDTVLGVYTGTAVNALTQVAADQDSGGSGTSRLTLNATAATTYRIAVWGQTTAAGSFGNYNLTVTPLPSISDVVSLTILEDGSTGPLNFTIGKPGTPAASLTLTGTSSNTNVVPNANIVFGGSGTSRTVTVTPAADRNGSPDITITVDDSVAPAADTFTLTITGVNDAPSFSAGPNQTVLPGSGAASIPNWATSISAGPFETSQTVNFTVTNDNNALFTVQPAVAPDGTLTYTPGAGSGLATVSVRINDSGNTNNGGVNQSAVQTFTISVCPWFGDFTALPPGAVLYGHAALAAGELRLTDALGNQQGSIIVPNLTGAQPVSAFDVTFDAYAGGGTASPADGYAFAWGAIPAASFGEEGPLPFTGLVVSFDIWVNAESGETAREVTVKWNGAQVGRVEFNAHTGAFVPVHIRLRPGGRLDVRHGTTLLFDTLPLPGFTALTAPLWGVGARTGGSTALQKLDNLRINPWPHLVTIQADSGTGSLRAALADAASAACPGPSQVHFAAGLNGQSVTLANEIVVNDSAGVLVDATGLTGGVTVNGGAGTNRVLSNSAGSTLELASLTLTGGNGVGAAQNGLGGAVVNLGTIVMDRCTLTGNTAGTTPGAAETGGAIYSHTGASLTLKHCTLSGNQCVSNRGGAIASRGSLTLVHCTVSANTGRFDSGGVRADGPMTLTNSIIAGNSLTAGSARDMYVGTITLTRAGANIVPSFGNDGGAILNGPVPSAADPLLAPLDSYGGPTQTMALQIASPARNTALGSTASTDQRGFPITGLADIGAYEAGTLTNYNAWIWETLPASATVAQHAAAADYDSDGLLNGDEWNYLTNPAGSASVFLPAVTPSGANLIISFPTAIGRTYTLQQSTNLGTWNNAPVAPVAGNGAVRSFTVPATGTRLFHRVLGAP